MPDYSGNFLKVNFVAMGDLTTDLSNGVTRLNDSLADLQRQAIPLVQTWTGDAQQAYYERQAVWENAAKAITEALMAIQQAVATSHQDYAATEAANASMFRR